MYTAFIQLHIHILHCIIHFFSADCCKSVTIRAKGSSNAGKLIGVLRSDPGEEFLGSYEPTEEEYQGAPVYKKKNKEKDRYLYRHSDGTWHAGGFRMGGVAVIKSMVSKECPASSSMSIERYQYRNYNWYTAGIGDITIQCNVHT